MKADNRAKLYARAERAIKALYHNATPTYPTTDSPDFEQWFENACENEIDYLGSSGAHGTDYRGTLSAECNAGKYKSRRAREQYVEHGMRAMRLEREDCGMLTGYKWLELRTPSPQLLRKRRALSQAAKCPVDSLERNNAMWEYIHEYGELHTYGRGGRTLAPADLWREDGRGHGAKVDGSEWNHASATRAIQVLESFNAHVSAWCASVPEQWADYERERLAEEKAEETARRVAKAKETRERRYWEARGVVTC